MVRLVAQAFLNSVLPWDADSRKPIVIFSGIGLFKFNSLNCSTLESNSSRNSEEEVNLETFIWANSWLRAEVIAEFVADERWCSS